MLTKVVGDARLVCARPQYRLSVLQADLTRRSFSDSGICIIEQACAVDVDAEGLVWLDEELSDANLLATFEDDLSLFFRASARRMLAYSRCKDLVSDVHRHFDYWSDRKVLDALSEAYIGLLKYTILGSLLIDKAYSRLESIIKGVAPWPMAELYLSSLLQSDATQVAIRIEFTEDTRETKRIEDVISLPVAIFGKTKLIPSSPLDDELSRYLLDSTSLNMATYLSLRHIVYMANQFAEEWRYADYSIRSHFRHFVERISLHNPSIPDPYSLRIDQLYKHI